MRKILMMAVLLVVLSGCLKQETVDPNTGATMTSYQINLGKTAPVEKSVEQVQAIAATVAAVAPAVAALFPWGAAAAGVASTIAGILAAVLGTWVKIKPKLTEAQDEAQMYHTISSSSVLALEEFKKLYPEQWVALAGELEKMKGKIIKPEDQLKIENLIRGLRGLPPKA